MEILLFLGYLALCLLVGIVGRNTRIGYWGTAVVSVVVTPFVVFIVLLLFSPKVAPKQS